MVVYLLFIILCNFSHSLSSSLSTTFFLTKSLSYYSYSYSYSYIQSISYLSKSNIIDYSHLRTNSYIYFSSKMPSTMPSIMPSIKEKESMPVINFETNLEIEGMQTKIFDELDKQIFLKTASHVMKISEQYLYWKNSYFEKQIIKTNLRTQNNNLKLRIIIQVNITLSGIYSQYIKNPTMLFTVLSSNLDLGLSSNTFNKYLQTLATLSNLFKFSNVNLLSAANNNLKILGVELLVNLTTNNPTLIPTFNPTINPTFNPTISPTINPTFNPTLSPTINPTINPTFNPTLSPTLSQTFNPTLSPTLSQTFNPTLSQTFNPTLSPTLSPTFNPTFNPTISPSLRPSVSLTIKPSNRNATSEKVLSSDNAGNMLIYLIYIPIAVVFISIVLCFTSYIARKKLARLNPDTQNKEYIHMKEPIMFKTNKVSDLSDKKIYKSAVLLHTNNSNSNIQNVFAHHKIDDSASDSDSDSELNHK